MLNVRSPRLLEWRQPIRTLDIRRVTPLPSIQWTLSVRCARRAGVVARGGEIPLVFTDAFCETLAAAGVEAVRLPARSPNLNAYAERFVRTIKESCLDRLILVGERSLRHAIREFMAHHHHERNHQGMGNLLLFPATTTVRSDGPVCCRTRLGGLLKYYHRPAA